MKKACIFAILVVCWATTAYGKFDDRFVWTTLTTPHFCIDYHQGEEAIAKRAAVIAEDVHDRLVPRIKWDPKGRTHIVLADTADESNGMTTPLPYKRIVLYITQPLGAAGFGSVEYDEWLRLVITHEYTHILHLDMVTGIPEVLQDIFGRIYFPNLFEPVWMIEGLAVYEETAETTGGRGRSPGSDMVLRMATLEDRFPEMGQAANYPDSWPAGETPYLFGDSFTHYLVKRFGREKFADVYVAYSGRGVPFLVDSTGKRVLHAEYQDLWNDWKNSLRQHYAAVQAAVEARGLTPFRLLTTRGYMNLAPAFSPDGSRIAYTVENGDSFPGIFVMNADGTNDRRLVDRAFSTSSSGASLAWSPDGNRLYYTRLDYERNTNLYNDLYYYDLQANHEVRVTRGLRARDPFPAPDGTKLLCVLNSRGKTRLALLDLTQGLPIRPAGITYLTDWSEDQYETPRYSPDGSRIVTGVWQPGGYKDIWILDDQGRKVAELMHDRAIDGGATWSPDNKTIYFTSDRSGIFDLYAYDVAAKTISQVANVVGGEFTPALSPDGKTLVFASYSSRGFDLAERAVDRSSWKPAAPFHDPYPVPDYADKPVVTTTAPYSPISTLLPRFWLPWFGWSQASGWLEGFLTFDQDAVERHTYMLTALYSPETYRTWYSFAYQYDGLYPTLDFLAQDTDVVYAGLLSDPSGSTDYTERSRELDGSMVFPFTTLEHQNALTLGVRRTTVSALTPRVPWAGYSGAIPAEGVLASGRVSYEFNNAQEYPFSISPEGGRTVDIGVERLDRSLGSDFVVTKYTADWHEYLDLPVKHQVLLLRGFGGVSTGEVLPQRAFQLGGDNPGDTVLPVDQQSLFLRGYDVNEFRGRDAALASMEYRFPIQNLERGWGNKPFFFRRLHGAVFADAGEAWDDSFRGSEVKRSVGAEMRLDLTFSYYLPLTLRLVAVKGLDDQRPIEVYWAIWSPALF